MSDIELDLKELKKSAESVAGYDKQFTLMNTEVEKTKALVETVKGRSIYQEFLEQHGEGLHHLGFPTPLPFDAELEKWEQMGIKPLQVNLLDDPEEGWAYMDTQKLAGFILEILSFKKFQ